MAKCSRDSCDWYNTGTNHSVTSCPSTATARRRGRGCTNNLSRVKDIPTNVEGSRDLSSAPGLGSACSDVELCYEEEVVVKGKKIPKRKDSG